MVSFAALNAEHRALRRLHAEEETTLAGARRVVSSALSEHDLQIVEDAPLALELRQANLGTLNIMLLGYGAAVSVRPRKLPNDLLFQVILRGGLVVEFLHGRFEATAGDAVLLEDLAGRHLHWSAGSLQLILRIPRLAVSRALGEGIESVRFDSLFSLRDDRSGTTDLIRYIMTQAANGRLADFGDTVLDLFVRHLLVHHSDYSGVSTPVPASIWRAEAYMREHLKDDIALADLVRAAKTTPRTLSANFQRFRGMSPMSRFRELRLDAVNAALRSGVMRSVTEAATTYGFLHLGRFSQAYRARFGELPKKTQLVCGSLPTSQISARHALAGPGNHGIGLRSPENA